MIDNLNKRQKIAEEKQLYDLDIVDRVSSVHFSSQDISKRDIRLIEITSDILKDIESGSKLSIIGDNHLDAVICSNKNTYSIKKVETSNSIFLIPPSDNGLFTIEGKCSDYYELKAIKGRVEQLSSCLQPSLYISQKEEVQNPIHQSSLLNHDDIRSLVQASEIEISEALKQLNVVEINGKLILLSKSGILEVIADLFNIIIENNMSIEKIDFHRCQELLGNDNQIDPVILKYALSTLGSLHSNSDNLWELDKSKVLKAAANITFTFSNGISNNRNWPCDNFLKEWSLKNPACLGIEDMDESLLRGTALKIGTAPNYSFCYFPSDELPVDLTSRFREIFKQKDMYTLEEIEPYIVDVVGPNCSFNTVGDLLVQHTKYIDGFYYQKL